MLEKILTDSEWKALEPLFPEEVKRGKPHASERTVINSIRFVLANNKWEMIPKHESFATKSVANRYYKNWKESGLLSKIIAALGDEGKVIFPPSRTRAAKIQSFANKKIVRGES